MGPDRRRYLVRAALWTLGLILAGAGISSILWGTEMALGLALGALVGLLNVTLLGRALSGMVDDPDRHRPPASSKWALPGVLLVKWPIVLLALACILWYMPARPEGVAVGVILSLVAAAMAAKSARAKDA